MEWYFWFAWWFLFYCRYSGLLWIYHQETRNFDWNPPTQIYQNKIKNRIGFKIKTGYKLELVTPETKKLLGSKKDFDKGKDGENVAKVGSLEFVLVHCNLVKNDYQHTSKVLFTFDPNKIFGQLINISSHSLTMINTVWSLVYRSS